MTWEGLPSNNEVTSEVSKMVAHIRPFLHIYSPPTQVLPNQTEPEVVEITRLEIVGHCPLCKAPITRLKSNPLAPQQKHCSCKERDTKDIWKLMLVK